MAVSGTAPHRPAGSRVSVGPSLPSLGTLLVLGWAFLLPVQLSSGAGLRLAPSDLLIAAYALLALPVLRRVHGAWSVWFVALVVVMWFALGRAQLQVGGASRHAVLDKSVGIVVLLITFRCVVDYISTSDRLRAVMRAFLLGAVANASVSLVTFALARLAGVTVPLVNEPYVDSRLSGLLIDPNAFGGLLATALVIHVVTTAAGTPLLRRRASVLATTTLPVALALTFSRSAWIGLLLGLVAVAAADPRLLRRAVTPLILPLCVVLPVVLINLPGAADLAERPGQVSARLDIISAALRDVADSPLNGIGLGVYEQRHGVIVHNTALWFLTEMGVIGLLVLVGFLALQVRRATWLVTRGPAETWVLGAALLGAVFVGIGLSLGIEAFYQRYWWMAFAAIAAARTLPSRAGPA
jgi:putative inorganic carbon (hco3(-)) transporter